MDNGILDVMLDTFVLVRGDRTGVFVRQVQVRQPDGSEPKTLEILIGPVTPDRNLRAPATDINKKNLTIPYMGTACYAEVDQPGLFLSRDYSDIDLGFLPQQVQDLILVCSLPHG